mmetsp:Transcript_81153/g.215438  ORF Transcript_81153/g.215438 Transcript_81153/m.215438 type:complete len:109 (-) Transcript_81153:209-535(-)
MFRAFLVALGLIAVLAEPACNPAVQVCEMDEIQEEMAAASKRGFAFIQAKSERHSAKARRAAHIEDSLATHNEIVSEEVERLTAKHGRGSVLHKRTMVHFTAEGDSEL